MTRLPVAALSVLDFCLSVLASRFVDSDSRQGRPYEVNDKPTSSLASGRDRVSLRLGSPRLPSPLLPPSLPQLGSLDSSSHLAAHRVSSLTTTTAYYAFPILFLSHRPYIRPSISISYLPFPSYPILPLFIRTTFSADRTYPTIVINLVIFEIKSQFVNRSRENERDSVKRVFGGQPDNQSVSQSVTQA